MPAKNTSRESVSPAAKWPARNKRKPITRLTNDQITFVVAEDNPRPGGLANGVGNLFPEIPATKCGTTLAKNKPAKKQATY